jgi:CRP-like cAMP-binding protein
MGRILKYSDCEEIIKRGSQDQRMFIILNGKVEISINDGLKKIVLTTLGKHDFFGEITLFNKSPRTADAVAVGSVKLTYIDNINELNDFLKINPAFSRKMAQDLAKRIADTNALLLKELGGKSQTVSKFYW